MLAEKVGLKEIFTIAKQGGRLKPFFPVDFQYFSFDPRLRMTFWSGLIGVFVAFLSRYGADQVVMQRYFTARTLKSAQKGMWVNAFVSVISLSLLVLFGLAIYVHTMKNGSIAKLNWEMIPAVKRKGIAMMQFVQLIRSFPSGLMGLIAAGLLAATMSSIDSGMNACSAAYVSDFHPYFCPNKAKSVNLWLDRGLTLTLGFISTALALALIYLVGKTNSLFMIVNKVINGLASPLLALFILGMFSKKINCTGIFLGSIFGIIGSLIITFAVKNLALQYYAVANLLITIIFCYAFSFTTKNKQNAEQLSYTWFHWYKNNQKGI